MDLEILIPADDPVRLLSTFVEGMELDELYKTYGKIKKNQATLRQLFKVIIYAGMNRIYFNRDIETACRRDVDFMYPLEGKGAFKKTLAKVTDNLYELGEISGKSIFIMEQNLNLP